MLETQIPSNLEHTGGRSWQSREGCRRGQEGPTEDAGLSPSLLALLSAKTLFCVSMASVGARVQDSVWREGCWCYPPVPVADGRQGTAGRAPSFSHASPIQGC